MTNFDIASAAATRPEDRRVQVENQLLNAFTATLADLRRQYAAEPEEEQLPVTFALARHRIRMREMNKAIARLATRLAAAGIR